jgi:hypothetical protein
MQGKGWRLPPFLNEGWGGFPKRANFDEMRKSYFHCMKIALTVFVFLICDIDKNQFFDFILDKASGVMPK